MHVCAIEDENLKSKNHKQNIFSYFLALFCAEKLTSVFSPWNEVRLVIWYEEKRFYNKLFYFSYVYNCAFIGIYYEMDSMQNVLMILFLSKLWLDNLTNEWREYNLIATNYQIHWMQTQYTILLIFNLYFYSFFQC